MRTIFLILIIFFIFAQKHAYTEPKIIKKISEIENFTFDFEQLINDKKETGNCIISFNNKMMCKYDETGKLIVSNGKPLLIKTKAQILRILIKLKILTLNIFLIKNF